MSKSGHPLQVAKQYGVTLILGDGHVFGQSNLLGRNNVVSNADAKDSHCPSRPSRISEQIDKV